MNLRIVNAAADKREAEILIYSPIGNSGMPGDDGIDAHTFALELKSMGPLDRIVCRINSPGGDCFDGFSIYNLLKSHGASVEMHVDGLAASAASFVMQAASPGKLFMSENSVAMIHCAQGGAYGDARDHAKMTEVLDKLDGRIANIYASRSGRRRDTMLAMMQEESWFSAEEAVHNKLADRVTPARRAAACGGVNLLGSYRRVPPAIAARYGINRRGGDSSVAARLAKLERDERQYGPSQSAISARLRKLEYDGAFLG